MNRRKRSPCLYTDEKECVNDIKCFWDIECNEKPVPETFPPPERSYSQTYNRSQRKKALDDITNADMSSTIFDFIPEEDEVNIHNLIQMYKAQRFVDILVFLKELVKKDEITPRHAMANFLHFLPDTRTIFLVKVVRILSKIPYDGPMVMGRSDNMAIYEEYMTHMISRVPSIRSIPERWSLLNQLSRFLYSANPRIKRTRAFKKIIEYVYSVLNITDLEKRILRF